MTHVQPRAKLPMSYEQIVQGPYCVSMMPDGLHLPNISSGAEAVDEFVRYCLAPIAGRTACITDANGVVALGYDYNPFAEDQLRWFGVGSAVRELQAHPLVEPALLASIEMALES